MGALKITNRFCPVHPLHKLISKKGGVWVRKRSIFYNALLLTGVNLLLRGVSMVFQVYLSRRIGAAGVGLLQLVLTVETAAITFGLSGARVAAMYLCARGIRPPPSGRGTQRADALPLLRRGLLRADRGSPPVRERIDRGYVAARAAGFGLPAHHGARPAPALLCRDPLRLLHSAAARFGGSCAST